MSRGSRIRTKILKNLIFSYLRNFDELSIFSNNSHFGFAKKANHKLFYLGVKQFLTVFVGGCRVYTRDRSIKDSQI